MVMKRLFFVCCLLMLTSSAGSLLAQQSCPPGLALGTNCVRGQDENGAFFLIAVPPDYNHRLVLWVHDFQLDAPRSIDTERQGPVNYLTNLGYAVAASSFRPNPMGLGGWSVKDGAEDTENLRKRFVDLFGKP